MNHVRQLAGPARQGWEGFGVMPKRGPLTFLVSVLTSFCAHTHTHPASIYDITQLDKFDIGDRSLSGPAVS